MTSRGSRKSRLDDRGPSASRESESEGQAIIAIAGRLVSCTRTCNEEKHKQMHLLFPVASGSLQLVHSVINK